MFDDLEKVPWHRLKHAYGRAKDAPKWIRALASDDEYLRTEAVHYFLYSAAFHQGTVYSATPHVIPFVLEALREPRVSGRPAFRESGRPMAQELLCFLVACAGSYRPSEALVRALIQGRETYTRFIDGSISMTCDYAKQLIRFCDAAERK